MLKDILDFFRRERFYACLLLAVVGLYVFFALAPKQEEPASEPSAALEKFREAEERLHSHIKQSGSFDEFLADKPTLKVLFQLLSFLAVGAFSLGMVIDFFLLFHPPWRRSLTSPLAPPPTERWDFSMLFKTIILVAAGSLLLSLLLAVIRQLFLPFYSFNFYLLVHATLVDILSLIFVVHIIRLQGGQWRDLGFRFPERQILRETVLGLGAYLAVLPLFAAVLLLLVFIAGFFAYEPPPHPLVEVFLEEEERSPALIAYSVFLAGVIGPIFEEIFFRGFCYPIFRKKWGIPAALVLSSAFFGAIHHNTFAFWPIFVLGMALAYLYEKRRSLLAPMVLHVTHNTFFITYFFLAKQIVMQEGGM